MLSVKMPKGSLFDRAVEWLDLDGVRSPSHRAVRILRLQGLYTVGQLADAAYSGALQPYPEWLQAETRRLLQALRPALEQETEERRLASRGREERIARLDWADTVIARPLPPEESSCLAGVDIRLLDCIWPVKHFAWYLEARDALDTAILDRNRLLAVETCGPARVETLRTALERALRGDRWPDESKEPPAYLSAAHAASGRALSPPEVASLAADPVTVLPLSARAIRAVVENEVETCLDLAALLDRDVWFLPGCGRRTFDECRRLVAGRLAAASRRLVPEQVN